MNPFIRLCGLKCHHGLRDLISRTGRLGSQKHSRCQTKSLEMYAGSRDSSIHHRADCCFLSTCGKQG